MFPKAYPPERVEPGAITESYKIYDALDAAEAAANVCMSLRSTKDSVQIVAEVVQDPGATGFKPNCLIPTIDEGWTPATRPNSCSVPLELISG